MVYVPTIVVQWHSIVPLPVAVVIPNMGELLIYIFLTLVTRKSKALNPNVKTNENTMADVFESIRTKL